MKIAYMSTYAFLGLLTFFCLMYTMLKAIRHVQIEERMEAEPVLTNEDSASREKAPQP